MSRQTVQQKTLVVHRLIVTFVRGEGASVVKTTQNCGHSDHRERGAGPAGPAGSRVYRRLCCEAAAIKRSLNISRSVVERTR